MTFHYTTSKNGALYPLPTGNNRTRENGSYTTDGNNDHHMITLNYQTCHWYETYQDNLTNSVSPAPAPYAASGWDYSGTSYAQPTDGATDAAGLPLMPLTVHLSEMQAGAIHHALRFTSCAGCISHVALWPAIGSTAYSTPSAPMGSRWRLKASYDDSKLSAKARIITTALKIYGMMLSDIGGISQIQTAQDINLNPSIKAAFSEVTSAHITQDQFEIVDESSLMLSSHSHQAKGGTPTSVPVLVGTPSPVIFPQSGMSYQLTSWVNGSSNQNVAWSLVSGAGAVTTAGVYMASLNVNEPTPFLLEGVAEADVLNLNPIFVSGYVMPSGIIRIDVGNWAPYTDTLGNVWLADTFGALTGSFNNNNDTWPPTTWAAVGTPPDGRNIFGWSKYTWGDDIQYGPFIVPNGTYSVQFWMAISCPAGTTYSESQIFNLGLTRGGTLGLEANGVMTLYNMGEAIGDACLTPATPTIQTVVTDNVLRVALRSTSVGNTQQAPGLNALIITPTALRFVLAPTTMNFGSQAIGGKSTQAVTVTNSGGAALLISSIGVSDNGDFAATSNCPASLAPNASCTVSVTFSPSALGNRNATLNVTTNAGSPQTVPLAGSGTGLAQVLLAPTAVNFASQPIGSSSTQTIRVTNSGTAALLTSSIGVSNNGDFAATSNCPASLAPNASCTVSVTFSPSALGNRAATLNIATNTAPQIVPLAGSGTGLAQVLLAPTAVNFASQPIGSSSTQTIRVANSGTAALLISSIGVSNNGDFAATSNCPASLAPNASCTVSITFSPPALGNRAATLNIATNTAPQTVPLAGSGTPRAPSFKHINVKVSPTPFSVPSAQQATAATERPHFLTSKDEKPQQSSISETKSVTTDSTGLVAARDNDGSGVREGYGLGVGTPSNCVKAHCPKDAGTRNLEEIDRYSPPIGNFDPIPHPAIQRGFALTVPLTKGYEVMFYGVVQLSKDHKTRGLFLVGGTHVFVGAEKEVIDDRYLILRLTTGSATIKDLQTQEQQALAIVPNAHRH